MAQIKGGRARSETARAAILAATRAVLAEQGYDGLTIERVAADAGVGKQTIYRWWPAKSALVAECVADGAGSMSLEVPVPDTGDIRNDLEAWLTEIVGYAAEPRAAALLRGLIAAAADSPLVAEKMYSRLTSVAELALARRLSPTRGEEVTGPARAAAGSLLGSFVYGILVNRPMGAATIRELAELIGARFGAERR